MGSRKESGGLALVIALIGLAGSIGAAWVTASAKAGDVAESKLVNATEAAIQKVNDAANARTQEVAACYRLDTRVRIDRGAAAYHLDFSSREYDPLSAVTPGTNSWVFRAPFAGEYSVNAAVVLQRDDGVSPLPVRQNAYAFLVLFKNGKEATYFGFYSGDSREGLHTSGAATVNLQKGDEIFLGLKYEGTPPEEDGKWGTAPAKHSFVSVVRLSAR